MAAVCGSQISFLITLAITKKSLDFETNSVEMSACSNTPSDLDLIGIKLIGETGIDFTSRDGHSQESNTSFTGSITMVSVEDSNASSRYSVSGLKTTGDVLGFVALPTASAVTLAEFRRRMGEQVTILPDNYLFLSREG